MARKVLGISWINGQFHATSLAGGTVTASWSAPEPVLELGQFAAATSEAIRQTAFAGQHAMVIIDHRSMLFHVQDTPPAEGKTVDQMLDRLVTRSQFFPEKAAWSRLALPEAKGRHRFLLALLPDSLVQGLVNALAAERIELIGVFPMAAVLGDQLRLLAAQEGETILLAADLGDAIHLLLGCGDGQVLFSRTVSIVGQQQAERAAQEINRTLHYAQQQFAATVNKLFVYGDRAFKVLKDFPIRAGLGVAASPVAADPLYYARNVFQLSPKLRLNFIPPSALKRKSTRQLAAVAIVLLGFLGLATTCTTEIVVRARERALQNHARQSSAEAEIRTQSIAVQNEANRWQALASGIGDTNDPPVPELFLRSLPTLPPAARLSRVDIHLGTNVWLVRLDGFVADQGDFIETVARVEQQVSGRPFQLQIKEGTRQQMVNGNGSLVTPQARRNVAREAERAFFIEGEIQ